MLAKLLRDRGFGAAARERPGPLPAPRSLSPSPEPGPEAEPEAVPTTGPEPIHRRWAFHPFLFAAFPALSLYAHNVYEVPSRALGPPIGLALGGTAAAWLLLWGLSRDARRAGLATSLLFALFFAFSRWTRLVNDVLDYLSTFWVIQPHDVRLSTALAMLAVPVVPALFAIFRRLKDPAAWTGALNGFALVLVALPAGGVLLARGREPVRPVVRPAAGYPTAARPATRPDIYYIILDAYGRSDVLRDLYGLDNEPFLRHLEQKGFFVARRSTSNYCQTRLSLSSSLNAEFLDALIAPGSRDAVPLKGLIGDNRVIRSLRPLGYKFVTFATAVDETDHPEADLYNFPHYPTSDFHRTLLDMTPLRPLMTRAQYPDFFSDSRALTLYILEHLPDVADLEGPTFTFVHVVSPHQPFVFGEDGSDVSPRQPKVRGPDGRLHAVDHSSPAYFREGYRRQAAFLTRRVEQMIDRILARSPEPPIIILQSDHGPGLRHHLDDLEKTDLRERMSILNCFYFPGRDYAGLHDRITPVNTFRVVLDRFFGSNLPLRDDRSYFSTYSDPFNFIDVTDRLRDGRGWDGEYTDYPEYSGLVH